MMNCPEDVARIAKWIQHEGWLEQFRLTIEVEATINQMGKEKRPGQNPHCD